MSANIAPYRPNGKKLVTVYVYCVWFEVGNLRGQIEQVLEAPITRMEQIVGLQKQIQSGVQARDEKGNIMIGGAVPSVMVTNWKALREDVIEEHVLKSRLRNVAEAQAEAEAQQDEGLAQA
jgi:hypothetical protein